MNLQHLGCWNHLEKLAEMFLITFYGEHILLILKIKKLLRKIKSKNLTAEVEFFLFLEMFKDICGYFQCASFPRLQTGKVVWVLSFDP